MIIVTNSDILGKNIRFLREKHCISRVALSDRIGWDIAQMQAVEEGRSYDIDSVILEKLCTLFEVDMDRTLKELCEDR